MYTYRAICLAIACLAAATVCAQADDDTTAARRPGDKSSLTLYFENDMFALTDRYYTNGMRISWLSQDVQAIEGNNEWAEILRPVLDFLAENDGGYTHNVGIALGQAMYTPEDNFNDQLVPDDRPYAGWTYLALSLHRKNDRILHVAELSLGIVGDYAFAHETQDAVHDLRGIRKSEGWDHQLDNEPGIILSYEQRRRYALGMDELDMDLGQWSEGRFGVDAIPRFSVSVGNVLTQASAGITARAGWNLPRDFHGNRIRVAGYALPNPDGSTPLRGANRLSVYVFGGMEGKGVLRDITLDGNTFAPSHSVDKNMLVGELEAGIGLRYRQFTFTYTHVYRTKEFEKQLEGSQYGAISVGYAF